MIGRILCRLGWHSWRYNTATDATDFCLVAVTVAHCTRPGCCMGAPLIVDVESRRIAAPPGESVG